MAKQKKNNFFQDGVFNLIISGYGGQGVLTLAKMVCLSALKQGFLVKETELHGLAQRGGSLNSQIRIIQDKNKDYAPLILPSKADLIIGLDLIEALRACSFANKKRTKILANLDIFLLEKRKIKTGEMIAEIEKRTKEQEFVRFSDILSKNRLEDFSLNIFFLGRSIFKGYLPLEKEVVWQVIKKELAKKHWKENKKAFDLSFKV